MNKRRIAGIVVIVVLTIIAIIALLFLNKTIKINTPSTATYPVRGVDVSSYQGRIDWDLLSKQGIQFVFIKATEGSSFVDGKFNYNYAQAMKTSLRVGAYHFFSYDSDGSIQADHFIATVPKDKKMLPPVVDLEFYGDKESNPPEKETVRHNVTLLLRKLEAHYGMKPILYATQKSYKLYLSGAYAAYDIWIRDVFFTPSLQDGREWTFWQFTDRAILDGYQGNEKYIDLNVYHGSQKEFDHYAEQSQRE